MDAPTEWCGMTERQITALKKLAAMDAYSNVSNSITFLATKHRHSGHMSPMYFQALQDVTAEITKLLAETRKETT